MSFNKLYCYIYDIAVALNIPGACKPNSFESLKCLIKTITAYAEGNLTTSTSSDDVVLGPFDGDKNVVLIACDGNSSDVLYSLDGGENQSQINAGDGVVIALDEGDEITLNVAEDDCYSYYVINR